MSQFQPNQNEPLQDQPVQDLPLPEQAHQNQPGQDPLEQAAPAIDVVVGAAQNNGAPDDNAPDNAAQDGGVQNSGVQDSAAPSNAAPSEQTTTMAQAPMRDAAMNEAPPAAAPQVSGEPEMDEPRVLVIGVGGAGGNAVNTMIRKKLAGVDYLAANTDAQALTGSLASAKLQLGRDLTRGHGAGGKPDIGRKSAEESADAIRKALDGAHMCFIAAGMGGGTGTGAAPAIAAIARELGVLTVGVVSKPFDFEGPRRRRLAEEGIAALSETVDTIIVIPNQNLFRVASDKTTFTDAFLLANEVLHQGVKGVTDLMFKPGLVNLDFSDVRAVMGGMGSAMMGSGEAEGEGRAAIAAEKAVDNPLLDDVTLRGARGVLINITGGPDMTLMDVEAAASRVRQDADEDADIFFGSTIEEEMEGRVRVSVVATGVQRQADRPAEPSASLRLNAGRSRADDVAPRAPAGSARSDRAGAPFKPAATPQAASEQKIDAKAASVSRASTTEGGETRARFDFSPRRGDGASAGLQAGRKPENAQNAPSGAGKDVASKDVVARDAVARDAVATDAAKDAATDVAGEAATGDAAAQDFAAVLDAPARQEPAAPKAAPEEPPVAGAGLRSDDLVRRITQTMGPKAPQAQTGAEDRGGDTQVAEKPRASRPAREGGKFEIPAFLRRQPG